MKKFILILIALLMPLTFLFSQSTIYKTDETKIQAKIVKIHDLFITYRLYNDPNKTLRSMNTTDIFIIVNSDGTVNQFNTKKTIPYKSDLPTDQNKHTVKTNEKVLNKSSNTNKNSFSSNKNKHLTETKNEVSNNENTLTSKKKLPPDDNKQSTETKNEVLTKSDNETIVTYEKTLPANNNKYSTIYKTDMSEIKAEIVEIQNLYIKYHLFGDPNKILRNVKVTDVFMIIYEDGTKEKFNTKPNINYENNTSVVNNSTGNSPQGNFIFGGKIGIFGPLNASVKDIYGSGLIFGFVAGYWKPKSGIEVDLRFFSKKGDPYTSGSVSSANSEISIRPLTITSYRKFHSNGKAYLGVGLGVCFIKESLTGTFSGQTVSTDGKFTGFELHTTGGIKFKPLFIELTLSSISIKDIDANLGGLILSGGFFF